MPVITLRNGETRWLSTANGSHLICAMTLEAICAKPACRSLVSIIDNPGSPARGDGPVQLRRVPLGIQSSVRIDAFTTGCQKGPHQAGD